MTYSDAPCDPIAEKVDVQPPLSTAPRPSTQQTIPGNDPRSDAAKQSVRVQGRARSQRQAQTVQCEVDEYNAWVRTQAPLPDKETRLAKLKSAQEQCRKIYKFTEADASAYRVDADTGLAHPGGTSSLAGSNPQGSSSVDHAISPVQTGRPLLKSKPAGAAESTTVVLGTDGKPANRFGLWEINQSSKGIKNTICMDADAAQAEKDLANQFKKSLACSKDEYRLVGNVETTDIACSGGSWLSMHSVTTHFGDTAYHVETTTHTSAGDSSAVADAKWLGACPQGMQPGDVNADNGTKVNALALVKSLSRDSSTAEPTALSPIGCISVDQVSNLRTPEDILPGVRACINSGDYDKAAQLYALSGVFGSYDMLRVPDKTAHQALQVLNLVNFASLTPEQTEAFKKTRLSLEPGSSEIKALCSKIQSVGPPTYIPTYMINHGLHAFMGGGSGNGLQPDFDAKKGWEDALTGFMNCSDLSSPKLTGAGPMNPFSGFSVVREVIIDSPSYNSPRALVRADDGGYFINGKDIGAWATKTDAEGKVLWTFQEPAPKLSAAHFLAAAPAADGGVLLCGNRDGFGPRGSGTAGLLIRLDKNGHEVSRIDPYLKNPEQVDQFIGVVACSRWNDGFMVSGGVRVTERSPEGKTITHGFPTIMRLHNDGTLMWQKNIQGMFENPRVMSNGDLVFFGVGGLVGDTVESAFLTRLDGDGNIRVTAKYPTSAGILDAGCWWIKNSAPSNSLQIACNPHTYNGKTSIVELGADLQITRKTEFDLPDGMGIAHVYSLLDGSLVFSGNTTGQIQRFVPMLVEIGPDRVVKAKHKFLGPDEWQIADFMPTGKPGEYVTIRQIKRGENQVTAMTFLKRN